MSRLSLLVLIPVSALSLHCSKSVGACDSDSDCPSENYCDLDYRLCFQRTEIDAGTGTDRPGTQTPSLTVSPTSPRVIVGQTLSVSVSLQRNGNAQPFEVRLQGLPAYVTSTPLDLGAMETQGTFSLSVAAGAPSARVSAKVLATAGGTVIEAPLQFEVRFPPGTIDTTFGTQGVVGEAFSPEPTGEWKDVELTARSELVLVGAGADGGEQIALLDSKGRPVTDFNSGAPVRFAGAESATAAAVSGDRFLVASVLPTSSQLRWIDRSGASTSVRPLPAIKSAYDLLLMADGSTTIFGYMSIQRLLPSGEPDSAFGTNGLVNVGGIGWNVYSRSTLLLPDGRYLIAGKSLAGGGSIHDAFLKCLLANGADDPTFGEGGLLLVPGRLATGYHEYSKLARTHDGKFVSAGSIETGHLVVKRALNGALDPSFGEGGIAFYPFPPGNGGGTHIGWVHALAIQRDGRILVAGAFPNDFSSGVAAVIRLLPDGKLDREFGREGAVTRRMGAQAFWTAIALDGDDAFVVAGYTDNKDGKRAFVSRYYQ